MGKVGQTVAGVTMTGEPRPRETHVGIFAAIVGFIGLVIAIAVGWPQIKKDYINQGLSNELVTQIQARENAVERVTQETLPLASDEEIEQFLGNWCSTDINWTDTKFAITRTGNTIFLTLTSIKAEIQSKLRSYNNSIMNRTMSFEHPMIRGEAYLFDFSQSPGKSPAAFVVSKNSDGTVQAATISPGHLNPTPQSVWHVKRC